MNIGIDIVSTKIGGGLDYILNLLNKSNPRIHNFKKLIIFTNYQVKDLIPKRNFIKIIPIKHDDIFWVLRKNTLINHYVIKKRIDLLFVPSALNFLYKSKTVVMNQTLLPFRFDQMIRYFPSIFFVKLLFIRFFQIYTFNRATGVIFLNKFGKKKISKYTNIKNSKIIPLGVGHEKYELLKKNKKPLNKNIKKIKIIYISEVTNYKNHYKIIKELKNSNLNFVIYFVGQIYSPYFSKLKQLDFQKQKFIFTGNLSSKDTINLLVKSDIFLFASSVENFPVSILEGLASNKQILAVKEQPVKNMIGNKGQFFSLNQTGDLESKIKKVIRSPNIHRDNRKYVIDHNYDKIVKNTYKYFYKVLNKK